MRIKPPPEGDPHRTIPSMALGPNLAEIGRGYNLGMVGQTVGGPQNRQKELTHPQPSSKEGYGSFGSGSAPCRCAAYAGIPHSKFRTEPTRDCLGFFSQVPAFFRAKAKRSPISAIFPGRNSCRQKAESTPIRIVRGRSGVICPPAVAEKGVPSANRLPIESVRLVMPSVTPKSGRPTRAVSAVSK